MHRSNTIATGLLCCTALLCLHVPWARAHSLHIIHGTLTLHAEHVELRIQVDGHGLAHWRGLPKDEHGLKGDHLRSIASTQMDVIARGLSLHDATGERLQISARLAPPNPASAAATEQLSYMIEYRNCREPSVLVMRYKPMVPSTHREQLVLAVRAAGQDEQVVLQLTSAGNAEFIEVADSPLGLCLKMPRHGFGRPADVDRFKRPHVELRRSETELTARIRIPLHLLETWIPLRRREADQLTGPERDALRSDLRDLFRGFMSAQAGSAQRWPQRVEISFATTQSDRMAEVAEPAQTAGLSMWTGHVVATLRWSPVRMDSQLVWRAFNPAVLTVEVRTGAADHPVPLTSYAPGIAVEALPLDP